MKEYYILEITPRPYNEHLNEVFRNRDKLEAMKEKDRLSSGVRIENAFYLLKEREVE